MLVKTVEMDEAKRRFFELIEQVEKGQVIILTRQNKPVARILAPEKKRSRQFGSAKGLLEMSADFDEPLEGFEDSV